LRLERQHPEAPFAITTQGGALETKAVQAKVVGMSKKA
jgi:hypothetical protein